MTLPNFFIVGAAKAGTSSIYRYLDQHPDIYFPAIKEPSYFAFAGQKVNFQGPGDEALNKTVVTDLGMYKALFANVGKEMAIGEASVVYLFSKEAPERIHTEIPNAKIIVILRNPVDRAVSSYSHLRRDGRETITDFDEALLLEEDRRRMNWQHLWQYTAMGFYAESIQRYYKQFGKENVIVYTYDELKENPKAMLKGIFAFLGVDSNFIPDISNKYNVSGIPRSVFVHQIFRKEFLLKSLIKIILPKRLRVQIRMMIANKNIRQVKPEVSEQAKLYLKNQYCEDIKKTSALIGKDLGQWLN